MEHPETPDSDPSCDWAREYADQAEECGVKPTDELSLRASSMPMAFLCPGSLRPPMVRIVEDNPEARLGTAAHQALAGMVVLGEPQWDGLRLLAEHHRVDLEELRILTAQGWKLWKQVRESFPNAFCEHPMSISVDGYWLRGTADIVSISENALRVADWKTGRKDGDYTHQMMAYAALALFGGIECALPEVTCTILWVRDGEIENRTLCPVDLERWVAELKRKIIHWDGAYHPGSHCLYCQRAHECEAQSALVRRWIGEVVASDGMSLSAMSAEKIVELHVKERMIAAVSKRIHDAIHSHVATRGPVDDGSYVLSMDTQTRRKLDTMVAFSVLPSMGFEDADMAQCVSVSLSGAEEVAKSKAPKRGGAAAIRALDEALEQAGAIKETEFQKLKLRRK
jgi:hypothetical protein